MSLLFSSVDGSYCATGVGSPVSFSYPIVFHAWIKRQASGGSGSGAIMVSGQNGSLDERNWMAISAADRGTNGARTTVQSVITTTTTLPTNQWFSLTALFHSVSYRQILYNGSVENTNSTSRITGAPDIFLIGRDPDGTNNFNGLISHAQVWTYGDIGDWPALREQIATRKPEDVEVGTLLNYWPDCTTDIVGSDDLTRYNTPVESDDEPAIFLASTEEHDHIQLRPNYE